MVDNWNGLALKIGLEGKEIVNENTQFIEVKVFSGEIWDTFVRFCVENNWSGVENLVMIPGTVGGAVAQNIGAYGQEIIDTVQSIEALNRKSLKTEVFSPKECGFRYRNTFFKNEWKEEYIIVSAIFKLKKYKREKEGDEEYHKELEKMRTYEGLKEELKTFAKEPYSIQDIMNAVINQRKKKLPLIEEYGTCGCIFENPIISKEKYNELEKIIPNLPSYPSNNDSVKISAGKLLDELGWKGKWEGNVGVFDKHALCVITKGEASGKEIYQFIEEMKKDVLEKYGIDLKLEINIIK